MEGQWSCYPMLLYIISTCGLSFTLWWLHSKRVYSTKVEAAIFLRCRPENWLSIDPAIFYCLSSYRVHPDSRGGATGSTSQWRRAKRFEDTFNWSHMATYSLHMQRTANRSSRTFFGITR